MIRKAKGRFVQEVVLSQLQKSSQAQDLMSRNTTQEQRTTVTSADATIVSVSSAVRLRKELLTLGSIYFHASLTWRGNRAKVLVQP